MGLKENILVRYNSLVDFDKDFNIDLNKLCGIDEAGRGPLIGPVVGACVILPENHNIYDIYDSKKISEEKRFIIAEQIKQKAIAWGIGIVDVETIDSIGIQKSNFLSFELALKNLKDNFKIVPELLLIDGNYKNLPFDNYKNIVKGDSKSACISAASILAKTTRDKYIIDICNKDCPQYNFAKNKGYGTKEHEDAIIKYGLTKYHRKTFCKKFLNKEVSI